MRPDDAVPDAHRPLVPSPADLALDERRERHPREFEVRDHVRQARALAMFIHGDEASGMPAVVPIYRDGLEGVAELLTSASEALELTALHDENVSMDEPRRLPDDIEDAVRHPMPAMLDGLPVDFTASTLTQVSGLVRLLRRSDDAVLVANRAPVLWTIVSLLGALVAVLDRVRLFDELDG